MAKRTTPTTGRGKTEAQGKTEGDTPLGEQSAAGETGETAAKDAANAPVSAGAAEAAPAPDTEGADDADKPAEAPHDAPAPISQEPTGGGDGDAPTAAGQDDAEALTAAVTALADTKPKAVIPAPMQTQIPSGYALRVIGPKRGRRRAGRNFGREPVEILLEDLTREEIAMIDGDPALTVEVIAARPSSAGG